MAGLVSQTIRSSGGTFRSARMRSRQVAGAAAFGRDGGIKFQCSAEKRELAHPKGPEAFDTICLNLTGPLLTKGDVWENQIRRKRNRQNLFVIQIIGRAKVASQVKNGRAVKSAHKLLIHELYLQSALLSSVEDHLESCRKAWCFGF